MSRVAVQTILLGAPGLPASQSWAMNALDTPTAYPFIVARWEESAPAFGDVGSRGLTVWVHDEPGDYARIDSMLAWIKNALTSAIHVNGGDGWIITQIDWTGDSPDFFDDGWRTITRNAGFRVISRAG